MSFQQRNVAVSLACFSGIMVIYLVSIFLLLRDGAFNETNVFRLWGVIIGLAVVVTILATILTHIVSAVVETIKTQKEAEVDDIKDERDTLIDLRGTKNTFLASSLGVFVAMLTFVFGQPPLVMFSLLIFFGVLAQIIGDTTRLVLYRRGV